MRIGIAGLLHETHTFLPHRTDITQFEVLRGKEVFAHRNRNSSMGGIINVCEEAGVELVPIVIASGGCSGLVEDQVYELIAGEICAGFSSAVSGALDGILLSLHGAMVTTSLQAPETELIKEVRRVVGQEMPIMVALDLHGNLNYQLMEEATAVFGYHSSPHVDAGETGCRTAKAMLDLLNAKTKPTTAMNKPGLVIPSVFSATTVFPAKVIMERVRYWMQQPNVIDVSFFFGFAWSDVAQLGASAVAITNANQGLAQQIVDDLADLAWSLHHELTTGDNIYSVKNGVALAIEKANTAKKPIVILDHSDRLNETTFVLRELLSQQAQRAAHPLLYDPEAAIQCLNAGQGNEVELWVGSKSSPEGGGPVRIKGKVLWVGEKSYIGTGPMRRGSKVNHGLTALVQADGVWIQITSRMASLIDEDPFIQFGYKPEDFSIIVTKSKTHFRAVYEDVGQEIIIVDAPAYSPIDLSVFNYQNVAEGVYPLTTKQKR